MYLARFGTDEGKKKPDIPLSRKTSSANYVQLFVRLTRYVWKNRCHVIMRRRKNDNIQRVPSTARLSTTTTTTIYAHPCFLRFLYFRTVGRRKTLFWRNTFGHRETNERGMPTPHHHHRLFYTARTKAANEVCAPRPPPGYTVVPYLIPSPTRNTANVVP